MARRRMNGSATARISIAVATRVVTPLLLERVLQRERVDDRREHAHVVGGRAVHAACALAARPRKRLPPPMTTAVWTPSCWISPMSLGDLRGDGGIDAELLLAHEGFAGQLEEDAMIDGSGHVSGDYIAQWLSVFRTDGAGVPASIVRNPGRVVRPLRRSRPA